MSMISTKNASKTPPSAPQTEKSIKYVGYCRELGSHTFKDAWCITTHRKHDASNSLCLPLSPLLNFSLFLSKKHQFLLYLHSAEAFKVICSYQAVMYWDFT